MKNHSRSFTISAYTTTRNAVEMNYPFVQSIESMLSFADEVCVLDSSDKNDGTQDLLQELKSKHGKKIKVQHKNINWKAPNHGIFDGQTKQLAREMCSGTHLFQFDIDEIVHEDHSPLVPQIIEKAGTSWSSNPVLVLPVVEFWGRKGKVRIDVNVWKPRISLNAPNIVHGIPKELRQIDPESGLLYAKHGTDTCDYINKVTGQRYAFVHFMNEELMRLQTTAKTNVGVTPLFEKWFNEVIQNIPGVYHYSWFNIERKIKQYRLFWTSFWKAMYNETRDERENPFFPGFLWSEVADEMIAAKALELEEQTGGWVFHQPWDGSKTNSITVSKSHPKIMEDWVKTNS